MQDPDRPYRSATVWRPLPQVKDGEDASIGSRGAGREQARVAGLEELVADLLKSCPSRPVWPRWLQTHAR